MRVLGFILLVSIGIDVLVGVVSFLIDLLEDYAIRKERSDTDESH